MDDLLQTALLGTAKQPTAPPADHPADALTARQENESSERRLLLRAGMRAVYDLAGCQPMRAEAIPAAPSDTRPVCSRRAAQILSDWIRGQYEHDLVFEAYQRLDRAGQRLPPDLLPQVLREGTSCGGVYSPETTLAQVMQQLRRVSQALKPVLGERGLWLQRLYLASRQDSEASVGSESIAAEPSPGLDEETWKEATHAERRATLESLRQTDPDRARAWLMAAWSTEKAEHRAELLEQLSVGLSARDEEFLESTLDDRSAKVQVIAARLLARLPESALAQRMRRLAETMFVYTPPVRKGMGAALRKMVGKEKPGTLEFHLPRQFEGPWSRDGIQKKPPVGASARIFWIAQMLALVPPSHWEAPNQAAAVELVAAAEDHEDGLVVLDAWSQSADLFEEQPWIQALWDAWYRYQTARKRPAEEPKARTWLARLTAKLEAAALEQRAVMLLDDLASSDKVLLAPILRAVPRPWSPALARKYLTVLRSYLAQVAQDDRQQNYPFHQTLYSAAVALPELCFEETLRGWEISPPEELSTAAREKWANRVRRIVEPLLEQFLAVVRLRKEFRDQVASITATGDHS